MRLAGYLTGVMGTGEHARQLAAALRTQGIELSTFTLHGTGALEDEALLEGAPGAPTGPKQAKKFQDFNLLCVNADQVPVVVPQLGSEFFAGRYTIGFWAWEVGAFPERFRPAFEGVDEVWVGSRHARDAIAPLSPVPVLAVPQPVSLADPDPDARPPAGLPNGYRFLFAFDYLSVFERKNPLAVVNAFRSAFLPGEGASLILKTLNHDRDPDAHAKLRAAAADHRDIHLLERTLPRAERDALIAGADCYVSLHRAEGFGYTMAESMWLGKPVIATGYSGNLDFMTAENSLLVEHKLIPIGPGHDPYPAEGLWAQPDVDHAARLMRRVFEHREEATAIGRRAARDIRATHAPAVAGLAMRSRLEALADSGPWPTPRQSRPGARRGHQALERAAELIAAGAVPPAQARLGAPQRLARRVLLRMLKPLTAHQRQVDGSLLEAVRDLDARLQELTRDHDERTDPPTRL